MKKTKQLINSVLEGKSAQEVLDEWSDLPDIFDLADDISQDLQCIEECVVTALEDSTIHILLSDKSYLAEGVVEIYEKAYPEYSIILTYEGLSGPTNKFPRALMGEVGDFIKTLEREGKSPTPKDVYDRWPALKNTVDEEEMRGWIKDALSVGLV